MSSYHEAAVHANGDAAGDLWEGSPVSPVRQALPAPVPQPNPPPPTPAFNDSGPATIQLKSPPVRAASTPTRACPLLEMQRCHAVIVNGSPLFIRYRGHLTKIHG